MPKYAAIKEDNTVANTILAETKEVAEELTGYTCIEYTDEPAEPGGTWDGAKFFPKKPNGDYIWSEEYTAWIEIKP